VVAGVIETFDVRRGDGVFRGDDGRAYYFHCVSIADGTRTISPGARARGRRAVGRLGHDEVVDVAPIAP